MMENKPEDKIEQTESPVVEERISVGAVLREARESQGLSIMDVAGQIKFAPRQIEALESGDLEQLPEMAFVRGFVRSYAKILKLDAQELLAALTPIKETPGDLTPATVNVPFPNASLLQRQNLIWIGVAIALLLVTIFVLRSNTDVEEHEVTANVEIPIELPDQVQLDGEAAGINQVQPVQAEPAVETAKAAVPPTKPQPEHKVARTVTTPAVAKPETTAQQTAVVRQSGAIRVEFIEESWLEVKDVDENILSSQIYQAGAEVRLEGNLPLSVLVGHAPSVRLYFKDKPVDLVPHTRRSTDVAHVMLGK